MDENSNAVSGDKSGETIWEGISLGHGEAMTNKQKCSQCKVDIYKLDKLNPLFHQQFIPN